MKTRLVAGLVVACLAVPVAAADAEADEYYGWAGLKRIPVVLEHKIERSEALTRRVYYVAKRDARGMLIHVRKMLDGKVFFTHEYTYGADGKTTEDRLTRQDGTVRIWRRRSTGEWGPAPDVPPLSTPQGRP